MEDEVLNMYYIGKKKQIEIANEMLKKDMSVEVISEITGLTIEEINKL